MAEIKYESKIGQVNASASSVYAVLTNLENLQRFKEVIPQDKIKELEINKDSIRFKVEGLGPKITIKIVEKEENKLIKYGAENIPIPLNAWIQLKEVDAHDTRMRITIKTDVPMMLRMMLNAKMQTSLDQAIDMLCSIKYE
jgi:uncharacterized membrane protein